MKKVTAADLKFYWQVHKYYRYLFTELFSVLVISTST